MRPLFTDVGVGGARTMRALGSFVGWTRTRRCLRREEVGCARVVVCFSCSGLDSVTLSWMWSVHAGPGAGGAQCRMGWLTVSSTGGGGAGGLGGGSWTAGAGPETDGGSCEEEGMSLRFATNAR